MSLSKPAKQLGVSGNEFVERREERRFRRLLLPFFQEGYESLDRRLFLGGELRYEFREVPGIHVLTTKMPV